MGFDKHDELTILSVKGVVRSNIIDGGDTVVLHVCCADGEPAAILLPREVARALAETLSKKVAEAAAMAAQRSES